MRELLEFKAEQGIKMPTHNPRAHRDHLLTWGEIFLLNNLKGPAHDMIEEAISMCKDQHGISSLEHGRCLILLANSQYLQRKHSDAGKNLEKAHRIFSRNNNQYELAKVYFTQARIAQSRGKRQEAMPLFEKALKIHQEYYLEDSIQLAQSHLESGKAYDLIGEPLRAKTHIEEARRLQLAYHPNASSLAARIHRALFQMEQKRGNFNEAFSQLDTLAKIYRRLYGHESRNTAGLLKRTGDLHLRLDQYDEAEKYFHEAIYYGQRYFKKAHPWIFGVHHNLGMLYHRMHRYEEAEFYFQKAIQGNLDLGESHHVNLGYHRMRYGALLNDLNRWDEALDQLCQAQELFLNYSKNPMHEFSITQVYLARGLIAKKLYQEADTVLNEAVPHLEEKDTLERDLVKSMQGELQEKYPQNRLK